MKRFASNHRDFGLIFNIQRFSVHDGPGIRTTVFLKGCPLKCPWCSNPESRNFHPELLVHDINCKLCGACVRICPQEAITMTKKGERKIDRKKCNLCFLCVETCLYDALAICGKYTSVVDVLDEVLQDRHFYGNSGGGVTLSGGEPLSQAIFTLRILEACKKEGLHTAIETTGVGFQEDMEMIFPFVDLVLFDIKHLNSKRHEKMTGIHNFQLLENLRKTAAGKPVWLRIPLIAGFNDGEGHIREVAKLGREIGVEKISLLPYHEGGRSKCEQLGIAYPFLKGKAPAEKRIAILKRIIEDTELTVSVGV